jgi:two-component system, sporulation sensor kinase D
VKIKKHKGILYIISVIIPTLFIAITFYGSNRQYLHMENEKKAESIASVYKQTLDKLVNNTITSLEVLSLVARTTNNDPEKIKQLLKALPKSTTDFSEYYYANPEGYIYLASYDDFEGTTPIWDRSYFQDAIKYNKTVFSAYIKDRMEGRHSIIAGTPVRNETDELAGVLIAILDLKNMEKTLEETIDYPFFTLHDENNAKIIGNAPNNEKKFYKETANLADIPWSVTIYVEGITLDQIIQRCIPIVLFVLVITHILYLLILYYMLKKEAALEKKQNETQKLELIGSLAANMAHEIRNPLTGIKGFVTLLSQKYDNAEDSLYFSIIQDEITRINEIISDFLVLGKPVDFDKQTYDLTNIIQEVLPMVQLEAKMNGILVEDDFTTQKVPIHCSKNHIKQILLNLSKNAIDAMEENDTLTIQVRVSGNYALLIVKDTGEGIPSERMSQIFQPFFTSKETGTGLGLVVCERIVDTYDGEIIINSIPGEGTTVKIFFPICIE